MKSPSHLLILLLVLPFFAIRVVARVVCFQSTCTSTYAPTNCVDAPTQPVGKTRREEASPLDSRGNGICYYPTGLLSKSLTVNTFSQVFFLPRGIYNLNWIEDITEGPPSTAIVFFELFQRASDGTNHFVRHLGAYGRQFVSDGYTGLVLALQQYQYTEPMQSVEVWVQAVT
ncbi:hypothetical protein MMC12_006912 [Toensbergia leucococca]|nr:hypothetical protein [Toensbergia leucococca]